MRKLFKNRNKIKTWNKKKEKSRNKKIIKKIEKNETIKGKYNKTYFSKTK
jgi:hypothetical protein